MNVPHMYSTIYKCTVNVNTQLHMYSTCTPLKAGHVDNLPLDLLFLYAYTHVHVCWLQF